MEAIGSCPGQAIPSSVPSGKSSLLKSRVKNTWFQLVIFPLKTLWTSLKYFERRVTIVFCSSWLSDSQFCKVVEDTLDYVECACSHMSVYAVYAKTDHSSSYNEAFFSSGFICISGQWQGFQVMNFKFMWKWNFPTVPFVCACTCVSVKMWAYYESSLSHRLNHSYIQQVFMEGWLWTSLQNKSCFHEKLGMQCEIDIR